MLIRIVAVGTRMPAWVGEAVDDYIRRLPSGFAIELREVRAEPRSGGGTPAGWMHKEAARIEAALPVACRMVLLDEHGKDLDSRRFAERMRIWQEDSRPVAILIGGPDGIDPSLKERADETIRLSGLTLPHPLVRVVLVEQLYRGWSILAGHPYHRQ